MRSFLKFAVLSVCLLCSTNLYALSITLDGTRAVLTGADCDIATYAFGINETWNGQSLDLHVEVLSEDNDHDPALTGDPCIGLTDGIFAVRLRDKDAGEDLAFVDTRITIVQRGTTIPVLVDRITVTGFDLDNTASTGTDDIYFTDVEAPYLSDQSNVIYSTGSFVNGHNFYFQGSAAGNCTDTPGTPVPECRAAASWVGGATNQISTILARFQNDNAYGQRGDAPASYGQAAHPQTSLNTLLSNGLAPDNDQTTQYTAGADGDDADAGNTNTTGIAKYDDEDSVTRNGLPLSDQTLDAGATEMFDVLTFGNGFLSAWIDLNIDGDFADAGEKILDDVFINNTTVGTTPVSVTIPQTATDGTSYVRFRFNNQAGLGFSGEGVDGEVEDYRVFIASMDPTFNMVKTASPATVTTSGPLTYTFTFNNTGNAVLSNLTITDPDIDNGTLTGCPIASLDPGTSATCTATRAVSQAQIDSGVTLTNTATPSGTNPLGGVAVETNTADNTVSTPVVPSYVLAIDKSLPANDDNDGTGDITANDVLRYTVTATNTGTGTLSNITVSDPMLQPSSATCASLPPAGTCVLDGTYTVVGGDIGLPLNNTATADSDESAPVSDTVSVVVPEPVLSIVKAVPSNADEDGSTDLSLNDTLTYTHLHDHRQ